MPSKAISYATEKILSVLLSLDSDENCVQNGSNIKNLLLLKL